ncbi:MAG TPA: hypothetical protein VM936_13675 [Pyrinomonadaceae bacterium]|jgi:hypothetical protein|nr:hypothetical protein [Pyrinomonadaceae bacterium]
MTIRVLTFRVVLPLCLTLLAGLLLIGMAGARRKQEPVSLPQVISKVKTLEVKGVSLLRAGEPTAQVAVEIYNNSDKPIISLSMETGPKGNGSGVSKDRFNASGSPEVILQPYGTITMKMPMSNVRPGEPIRVAAVMYADGTTEGDPSSKKTIEGFKQKAEKHRHDNQ